MDSYVGGGGRQEVARNVLHEIRRIVDDVAKKAVLDFSGDVVQDFYNEAEKRGGNLKRTYDEICTGGRNLDLGLKDLFMGIAVNALCQKAYKEIGTYIIYDLKEKVVDGAFCAANKNLCAKVYLEEPIFNELISFDKKKLKEMEKQGGILDLKDSHKTGIEVMYREFIFLQYTYKKDICFVFYTMGKSSIVGPMGEIWNIFSIADMTLYKTYQLGENSKIQTKILEMIFDTVLFVSARKSLNLRSNRVSSVKDFDYKKYIKEMGSH